MFPSSILLFAFLLLALLCAWGCCEPYDQYVLSPASRLILPTAIYRTTGSVRRVDETSKDRSTSDFFLLQGPDSSITYDFGQMTSGVPTIHLRNPTCDGDVCQTSKLPSLTCDKLCQGLGLAYSEQARFVGFKSDKSTFDQIEDGTVFLPLSNGSQTIPSKWGRGSFRYLTLSLDKNTPKNTSVELQFTKLHYTAAPNVPQNQLRSYTGYFHSSDGLLNRIWYAGAYTIQLCSITANSSVQHTYVALGKGWADNAKATGLTPSDVLLADGGKRDRNPWSGDVSVALWSTMVAQNYQNLRSVRNTIQENIILQSKAILPASKTYGYFPYAGSPLVGIPPFGSDTYHLWTIYSYIQYVLITGDIQWGKKYWTKIVKGITGTYKYVDEDGLFNGQGTLDWGRQGVGGKNTALNALYYRVLLLAADIAHRMPNDTNAKPQQWQAMAAKLKHSANRKLFDSSQGLYWDNTTTAGHLIHPQDGNTFAINFNLTQSPEQMRIVARGLARRWTKYGAPAPELPGSISPFITSHEINAQFQAHNGNATLPLQLIRTQWGYMLRAFSNATTIEGYGSQGQLSYGFYGNANSFISNTHAWSTGPVYSLLYYIVGIQPSPTGKDAEDNNWVFKPWVLGSGLKHASGGFNTTDGKYEATWKVSATKFIATVMSPSHVNGTIFVPTFHHGRQRLSLTVDGNRIERPDFDGLFVTVSNVRGGCHTISLEYGQ